MGSCSAPNADFDPNGETTGTSTTTASTGPVTSADTTGMADSSGDTAGVESWCEADLYAINQAGNLYALDVDTEQAVLVLSGALNSSLAMATLPDGRVVISPLPTPSNVRVIDLDDPGSLQEHMIMVDTNNAMERAAFDVGTGRVWFGLGTMEQGMTTNVYTSIDPMAGAPGLSFQALGTQSEYGDIVFVEPNLMFALDRSGAPTGFRLMPPDTPAMVMPSVEDPGGVLNTVSGLALDGQGRMWASMESGMVVRLNEGIGDLQYVVSDAVGDHIDFDPMIDGGINDLAPIREMPEACAGG